MTASDRDRMADDVLDAALRDVPMYAGWSVHDPGRGTPVAQRYRSLPVLTKDLIRRHFPDGLVPRGRDLKQGLASGEVEFAQTSGSTADALTLVFHRAWWEASEEAAWGLNAHVLRAVTGEHREVVLASPRCVGPGYSEGARSMAQRTLGRHLYVNEKVNPATWDDDDVRRMADELAEYRPVAVEGDPAYLAAFARRAAALGLHVPRPAVVFLTYSFPARRYLRAIRGVFDAPLVSSYGSTETGHVFLQCEAGRLHENVEHCRTDFAPFARRHGGPARGRIFVSVLRNPWFPVLRFDIGDVVRLSDAPCPCGRNSGLTLAAVEGRITDVTFASDGRAVTVDDLDCGLDGVEGLLGYQVDCPAAGVYRARVLADGSGAGVAHAAVRALRRLYGQKADVTATAVSSLEHEASGKFRLARTVGDVDWSVLWRD